MDVVVPHLTDFYAGILRRMRAAEEVSSDLDGFCGRDRDESLYLVGASLVVGAVVLVDDDGVLDVLHHGVLEHHPLHERLARPPPCLYPQSILRPREHRRVHRHVLHPLLVVPLPQAPDAVASASGQLRLS